MYINYYRFRAFWYKCEYKPYLKFKNFRFQQTYGIYDGFRTVVKNDGFLGLYRGLLPAYVRCFPCLAIQFWCLEKGKQLFGKNKDY